MSVAPGWSAEEIRRFVLAYERVPHGSKRRWLADQGVSYGRLMRWRSAVFDGDVDKGLVPRDGVVMTQVPKRRRIAAEAAARDEEIARLQERVRQLEEANDVLGKAIGLLHAKNVHEPDGAQPPLGQQSS